MSLDIVAMIGSAFVFCQTKAMYALGILLYPMYIYALLVYIYTREYVYILDVNI